MNEWERLHRQAERYKETYPSGTRIVLLRMGNDPRPIEDNTRGTVDHVDDIGTLHCHFDNGRFLGLVPGEDSFRKLTAEELAEENTIKSEKGENEMDQKMYRDGIKLQDRAWALKEDLQAYFGKESPFEDASESETHNYRAIRDSIVERMDEVLDFMSHWTAEMDNHMDAAESFDEDESGPVMEM